ESTFARAVCATVATSYEGARATPVARYAGDPAHAARSVTRVRRVLRMGSSLADHSVRARPGMEWLDLGRTRIIPASAPRRQTTDEDIEERREDETEEGDAQHSREHRDPHDVAHLGARSARQHQGHHAHDERER